MKASKEHGFTPVGKDSRNSNYADKIRILKDWMQSTSITGLEELTADWEELSFLENSYNSLSTAVSLIKKSTKASIASTFSKSIIRRARSGDKFTIDQIMQRNIDQYSTKKHLKTEGQEYSELTEPILYAKDRLEKLTQGYLRNSFGSNNLKNSKPAEFLTSTPANIENVLLGHQYQTNQPLENKALSQSDDDNSVQEFKLERSNTFGDPEGMLTGKSNQITAQIVPIGGSTSNIARSSSHRSQKGKQKNALWSRVQRNSAREFARTDSISPQATSISGILKNSKLAQDQEGQLLVSGDLSSTQRQRIAADLKVSNEVKQSDPRKILQTLLATATPNKLSDAEPSVFVSTTAPPQNLLAPKKIGDLPAIPETNLPEQSPQLKMQPPQGLFDRSKRNTAPKAGIYVLESPRANALPLEKKKTSLGSNLIGQNKVFDAIPSRFGPYKLGSGGTLGQKHEVGNRNSQRHSRTQTSSSMVFRAPNVPKGPKIQVVSLASPSSGSQDTPAISEQKQAVAQAEADNRLVKPALVKIIPPVTTQYPAGTRPRHRSPRYENIIRTGELALSKIYGVQVKAVVDSGQTSHRHTTSLGEHNIELQDEHTAELGGNSPRPQLNRLHTLGMDQVEPKDLESIKISLSSFCSPDSGDKPSGLPLTGFALKMQAINRGQFAPEDQPLSSIRKPQMTFGEIQSPPLLPKRLEVSRNKELQELVDFSPKNRETLGQHVIEEESEYQDPSDLISHFKPVNPPPRPPSRPN